MCGIFGFAKLGNFDERNLSIREQRIMISLLAMLNESRGKDSTGLAVIGKGEPFIIKKTEGARDFLSIPIVHSKLALAIEQDTRLVLGHTRQATTGEVSRLNAQPFVYKSVIGTHNGMVGNYKNLFESNKLKPLTTCDSEIIFALLSQAETPQDQVKKLSECSGWLACAFYDTRRPNNLGFVFARNDCEVMIDRSAGLIVWASESDVIDDIKGIFSLDLVPLVPARRMIDDYLVDIDLVTGNFDQLEIDITPSYYMARHTSIDLQRPRLLTSDNSRIVQLDTCAMCRKKTYCKFVDFYEGFLCKKCRKIAKKLQKGNGAYGNASWGEYCQRYGFEDGV